MREDDALIRLEAHGVNEIPDGWRISKVKYLADYINGYPFKPGDWGDIGKPIIRIQNLTDSSADANRYDGEIADIYLVKEGDFLISWSASLGLHVWNGEPAWLNQHIFRVDLYEEKCTRKFFRWLATWFMEELARDSHGSTMQHLTKDAFGSFPVLIPEKSTQIAIADFLDSKTAKLDELISAKQNLLQLLAEKRRALITQAVTKGLDASVAMKDSGIPGLGEIPAHWRLVRLRFLLDSIEQGWSPQCDNFPASLEEWGVVKAGCVNGWTLNENENKRLPNDLTIILEYEIKSGDILMSRANTTELLGSAVLVENVRPKLLLCDKIYRLKIKPESPINKQFVVFVLRSAFGRYQFEREATGASNSMQNIGQEIVTNCWIPVPPPDEQQQIANHVKEVYARIDALRQATERTIKLLQERRAALISDAVTGKIPIESMSSTTEASHEN